jgi:hypothetical protein
MQLLIERLGISVDHLKCLDEVFSENHEEYRRIQGILDSESFASIYKNFARELYAGGKQMLGGVKLHRQMILGDIIQYIFTGRAYYYASTSEENLRQFILLLFYSVNQLLIYDIITVNPELRTKYVEKLEQAIPPDILYEKNGDNALAQELKTSTAVILTPAFKKFDAFVDSILPKTLGAPKELVVFAELIRLKKGIIIPLLLIQRVFGEHNPIAPPDFLLAKRNKDIFGIEVGFKKELQSRQFSVRTSIPTFAVDLKNNMHNRCPVCGENILYCDPVIIAYSRNELHQEVVNRNGKFFCHPCPLFDNGNCIFSNYYGRVDGTSFTGQPLEATNDRHYHTKCVKDLTYKSFRRHLNILENKRNSFFAQIPEIEGIEGL